jgi:hypothetical protein
MDLCLGSTGACRQPGTQRCGRCRQRLYCSRECAARDWVHHKRYCRAHAQDDYVVEHTDRVHGHRWTDAIVIYSLWGELYPLDDRYPAQTLVPQWFSTYCKSERSGTSIKSEHRLLCLSFREMDDVARTLLGRKPISLARAGRVLFYHSPVIVEMNDEEPWDTTTQ